MKDIYSVKEIASMFHTNPETVRRWIRDKKIKIIEKGGEKSAQYATKDALIDFTKTMPKYAPLLVAIGLASPVSIPMTLAVLTGGEVLTKYLEANKNENISKKDLGYYIENLIDERKNDIKRKKNEIEKLNIEIEKIELEIKSYEKYKKEEKL